MSIIRSPFAAIIAQAAGRGQGREVTGMTDREVRLTSVFQALMSAMDDSESERFLAFAEGMLAAVNLRAQAGA